MKRMLVDVTKVTLGDVAKAAHEAAKGKRNRYEVKMALNDPIGLYKLRQDIVTGNFKPTPYKHMTIEERGKVRELTIPAFYPDQIVHHVLINLIKERCMKIIDPMSASSIPGRGKHYLREKVSEFMREHYKYSTHCLKADIRKCYPSLKWDKTMMMVKRYFKGDLFLQYTEAILKESDGLALGNYMSSWLLNIALIKFDHRIRDTYYTSRETIDGKKVKKRIKIVHFYCRYMDDIVILSNNKIKLEKVVIKYMRKELDALGLSLKFVNVFNTSKQPIDFVGFKFKHDKEYIPYKQAKEIADTFFDGKIPKHILHIGMRKKNFIEIDKVSKRLEKIIDNKEEMIKISKSYISKVSDLKHFNSHIMDENRKLSLFKSYCIEIVKCISRMKDIILEDIFYSILYNNRSLSIKSNDLGIKELLSLISEIRVINNKKNFNPKVKTFKA